MSRKLYSSFKYELDLKTFTKASFFPNIPVLSGRWLVVLWLQPKHKMNWVMW